MKTLTTKLKKNYQGRMNRAQFTVVFFLAAVIYAIAFSLLLSFTLVSWYAHEYLAVFIGSGISFLFTILMFVIMAGFIVRRSHDMNKNAWFSLLYLIPYVCLIFFFKSGSEGENRYAPKPEESDTVIKVFAVLIDIFLVLVSISSVFQLMAAGFYIFSLR